MSDDIEYEVTGPAQERRNVRKVRGVVYSDSPPKDQRIAELEAELQSLDRIRDVMSEYLSDECVPMSEVLAALEGEET